MKTTVTLLILLTLFTLFSLKSFAQDIPYTSLEGHTDGVRSVAFHPDEKTLASGGTDGTVRLWNVETGENTDTLTGHTDGVTSIAFNPDRNAPDGNTLASGSSDGTVRLWQLPPTRVTLTPNPVVLPPIGEQFTINVNIVAGENIAGYQASLRFDATALRYVEGATADYLPLSFLAPPVVSENEVTLAVTSLKGLSNGDGTLATVTFEVLALKESVVEVFDIILSDGKGEHLFSLPYGTKVTTGRSPEPDLVVEVVSNDDPYEELDIKTDLRFNLKVRVKNQGTRPSTRTTLRYYHSANDKVSNSDTEIFDKGKDSVPALNPGETFETSRELQAPEVVGDHYYKVYVDSDESNTDNNWSDVVRVFVYGGIGLKLPSNLISNVAFGRNSTYFVVNAKFPSLYSEARYIYGNCVVTFDIPGVPADPMSVDDPNNLWLDDPGYFMYPLQTPRARLAEIETESNLDTSTKIVTSLIGVVAGTGIGAVIGSVVPVLGTAGGSAVGALAGKAIGGAAGFFVGFGLRAIFEDEGDAIDKGSVLAATADPTLIFWPRAEGTEPPAGTIRTLLLVEQEIRNIKITVEQVFQYKDTDEVFTVKYEGFWNLEETFQRENPTLAAPRATPMSLSDYPPFQELPPEVQEYLRQQFREFTNTEVWEIPEATALLPNYPNPFNPETWIPYRLADAADVQITIYDITGAIVRQLTLGHQLAENYTDRARAAYWDGRNKNGETVASGIYFYQLRAGDYTATKRMLIRK